MLFFILDVLVLYYFAAGGLSYESHALVAWRVFFFINNNMNAINH